MNDYDMIIVGGGMGGLALGALLGQAGKKILLIEKNKRVGGKGLTFERKGFKYEMWPIGYMPLKDNAFHALFEKLGIESELKPAWDYESDEPLVGFYYKGRSGRYDFIDSRPKDVADPSPLFDLWKLDENERESALGFLAQLVLMAPEQVDELDDVSMKEFMARFELPRPLIEYMDMHSNISLLALSDTASASEQVKILQEMATKGAAGYFKGGYERVGRVLADYILNHGGEILTDQRIESIDVQDGQVTGVTTKDKPYSSPIVISNAGIQPTVLKLVGEEHFAREYVDQIKNLEPGMTLLTTRYFLSEAVLDRPLYLTYSGETVWDSERYQKVRAGGVPDEVGLWIVVPSNYDSDMAPEGKQIVIASTLCAPDPQAKEVEVLWDKIDEMVGKLFPDLLPALEFKERGGPSQVSKLARDQVLPNQGGEAIGLGQIVGQCGRHKPASKSPIQGLFYVGTDAGGYGVGTVQAVDSAFNCFAMIE